MRVSDGMNVKKLKPAESKEVARELFLKEIPQKEIARILKVTEPTISTWVNENDWKVQRAQLLARQDSRVKILANLIDYQLESIQMLVTENRRKFEKKESDKLQPIDKGEIDALIKMFSAVKGSELSWTKMVDVVRDFMGFLNERSPDLAKALVIYSDEFLLTKREAFNV